jgi:hypothetical protein
MYNERVFCVKTSGQILLNSNVKRLTLRQPAGSCDKRQAQSLELKVSKGTIVSEIVFDTMKPTNDCKIERVICLNCNNEIENCPAKDVKLPAVLLSNCVIEYKNSDKSNSLCEIIASKFEQISESEKHVGYFDRYTTSDNELYFIEICEQLRETKEKLKSELPRYHRKQLRLLEQKLTRIRASLIKSLSVKPEKNYIDFRKIESLKDELCNATSNRQRRKIQKLIDFLRYKAALVNC